MILHGKYVTGIGKASQYGKVYLPAFNCPMHATFNVEADGNIEPAVPAKVLSLAWPGEQPKECCFWLCQINGHWAWALRHATTGLPPQRLEFVSKQPLPDTLKTGDLEIEVFEPWSKERIHKWSAITYQWQGFDWLPQKRVDSDYVWRTIEPHAEWSGATVLDVGSHYGYHSFQASKAGATVTAFERDEKTRAAGELIGQHIEMQDVAFHGTRDKAPLTSDLTLYLSVHHQHDPKYARLSEWVDRLRRGTRWRLFVEVILPPLFGRGLTEKQVDERVGGEVLATYHHRMRGTRRIYKVEGKA